MKISNMTSTNGNKVANQFILRGEGVEIFQSYKTMIVKREGGRVFLDVNAWNYSATTSKYRNQFLGEKKVDTERKIKNGEYILANLNE